MPLRLIFMGTPEFAVPTLRALHDAGHEIVAVYTREPKPGGRRGLELQQTPVEKEARQLGIPVETPKTLRTPEALEKFDSYKPDVAVVVAYGMILPQTILDVPRLGCFNLHASRLPKWRGAAPIHRAIMAGDKTTGVMVMKMDAGLDTGEVVVIKAKSVVRIGRSTTVSDLHDQLALLGANLMTLVMDRLRDGSKLQLVEQSEKIPTSYAEKIDKSFTQIDWSRSRDELVQHINGLSPFPGAWCELPEEGQLTRLKILRCSLVPGKRRKFLPEPGTVLDDRLMIACADGAIRLNRIQRAGKGPMEAEEFLRGTPLKPPARLT
jgi:methionyl-tRNA formyltransferase